jgi:hypothetical protein
VAGWSQPDPGRLDGQDPAFFGATGLI